MSDLIYKLPKEIKFIILSFLQKPQSKYLLEDINSFIFLKKTLIEMYSKLILDKTKEYLIYKLLKNNIITFLVLFHESRKLYEIHKRNIIYFTNKKFADFIDNETILNNNIYDYGWINLYKIKKYHDTKFKKPKTIINILFGLMNINERKLFIIFAKKNLTLISSAEPGLLNFLYASDIIDENEIYVG
jgi:hypothetical protein